MEPGGVGSSPLRIILFSSSITSLEEALSWKLRVEAPTTRQLSGDVLCVESLRDRARGIVVAKGSSEVV